MGSDTSPSPDSDSPPSPPSSSPSPPPPSSSSPPPSTSPSPKSSPTPPPASSPPPPASSPPPDESSSPPSPDEPSDSPPPPVSSPPSGGASPPPPSTKHSTPTPSSPTLVSPPPPQDSSSLAPPLDQALAPPGASRKSPPPPHTSSGSGGSPPPPPSSSSSSSSSSGNTGIVMGVVVAGIIILAVIIICATCTRRKKKRKLYYMDPPHGNHGEYYNGPTKWNGPTPGVAAKFHTPPGGGGWVVPPPHPGENISGDSSFVLSGSHRYSPPNGGSLGANQSSFTYEELAAATGEFSQANLLGQGGFGFVHKGVLSNGKEVAVKSLKSGSGQGEREFQAEVEIISRVHHRHLVSLVGYCIADGQRMLVYEFVPNKTLEFHLHGKGQPTMDWATRLRIALGSAKGLAYLHEDCHPRIIHRDIKAANILLDNNFEAMVADFGLAKLSSDNYTHVSTRVMGTFGYLAPEYASSGKLSDKSDVFSFGVMLLELITGRRPVDPTFKYMEDSLVDWARPLLLRAVEENNYDELVDPRLESNFVPHEMARMVACAAASIRHSAKRRCKMSQIVRTLEGNSSLDDLINEGVKPSQNSVYSSSGSSDTSMYNTGAYNADMMKFKKLVLSSQDLASSDFGATSEYGLNPSSSSSDSGDHVHSRIHKGEL